ncbi:hypothetical protein [Candidatus Magnetominusculus xianensis]|uniref:Uncharacterized protein n=1 Tax=Candidatus Magnetominusculus xianensis TaxID=1748249 RepID=A0ABR5SHX9_9BACT|nr:hypothetical protein [Candidatus Magnetominusculus xianensis]KWT91839.1 hypothetical protein ASN18_0741 [Candidatus Magnetominusculus xianensis]MBF0403894.1 hypothetical protein [Nitrospirota bacterium]
MGKNTTPSDVNEALKPTQQEAATPALYCRSVDARRVLEGMAVDPLIGMAELARDPDVDSKTRAKIYMELAQYIYEKKKAAAPEETIQMETYEERLRRIRGEDNFITCTDTTDTETQDEEYQDE